MPQMLRVDSSRATEKIVCGLSLKTVQNRTIYMKDFVGVHGVQNCQAGRYRSVLFPAPTKGGIGQRVEPLATQQRRVGGR
jgi:hypothetical protein